MHDAMSNHAHRVKLQKINNTIGNSIIQYEIIDKHKVPALTQRNNMHSSHSFFTDIINARCVVRIYK